MEFDSKKIAQLSKKTLDIVDGEEMINVLFSLMFTLEIIIEDITDKYEITSQQFVELQNKIHENMDLLKKEIKSL